jgi:hypothetical protein
MRSHGPTECVRGSHLFGRSCVDPAGTEHEAAVVAPCGPAGSVCMFNNQVWHRGRPNRSERTRYITQISYAAYLVPAALARGGGAAILCCRRLPPFVRAHCTRRGGGVGRGERRRPSPSRPGRPQVLPLRELHAARLRRGRLGRRRGLGAPAGAPRRHDCALPRGSSLSLTDRCGRCHSGCSGSSLPVPTPKGNAAMRGVRGE